MAAATATLAEGAAAWVTNVTLVSCFTALQRHASAIFTLSGAQMSVPLYNAINTERGATLDTVTSIPLNNAPYLTAEMGRIAGLSNDTVKLAALAVLVYWSDGGRPGVDFYDDLGVQGAQPHLVGGPGPATDPGYLTSALEVTSRMNARSPGDPLPPSFPTLPRSWSTLAKSMYAAPLTLVYPNLPAGATYNITIAYGGPPVGLGRGLLSLTANGLPVHPPLAPPIPMSALVFPVPPAATAGGGALNVSCVRAWTDSTSGTGCAIAEVRLVRTN